MIPFCYLLLGGLSLRSLMPGWTYPFWSLVEAAFRPWIHSWAMFAKIVLKRLPKCGVMPTMHTSKEFHLPRVWISPRVRFIVQTFSIR
jgi:hypothetical protein